MLTSTIKSAKSYKGPSKENRHDPIIRQALLLDADLVPLAMQMYPGNESEKPYIRKVIEEMKQIYKVSGKTVQVADKELTCARNIYATVKETDDGYIFSKSIRGTSLSRKEKEWLLLENEGNVLKDYTDESGKLLFRLKTCTDTFRYSFKDTDPGTRKDKVVSFSVKKKRVVSYNPALTKKQKAEMAGGTEKRPTQHQRRKAHTKNPQETMLPGVLQYFSEINAWRTGSLFLPS